MFSPVTNGRCFTISVLDSGLSISLGELWCYNLKQVPLASAVYTELIRHWGKPGGGGGEGAEMGGWVEILPVVSCYGRFICMCYRRLHLPVNTLAQNMFSRDVKRLSFRCQTFKFSHPTVKFYFSTLLKGKIILINKKGINYQKGVPLSMICGIKWKNLLRIILSQNNGKD